MNRKLHVGLAGLFYAALCPTASAETKLTFLNAWDEHAPQTRLVAAPYAEYVTWAVSKEITFTFSGPEKVRRQQQFGATARGAFDLNLTTALHHLNTTAVAMGLDAMDPDPKRLRDSGVWRLVDKEFQRHGQKLVAAVSQGTKCDQYQLLLRQPYDHGKRLVGVKIRADPRQAPIVEPLGALAVNLPRTGIHDALKNGQLHGLVWPIVGGSRLGLQEIAKYMVRPRFGCTMMTLRMNLNRFNKLNRGHRAIVLIQGRRVEDVAPGGFDALLKKEIAALRRRGAEETKIDDTLFKRAVARFRNRIWEIAETVPGSTAAVQELRALARAKGLAE